MGMDGLSFSNTGVKESTSAEYANKTEQAVQAEAIHDSQQVQNLGTHPKVRGKDKDEDESKKNI